MFLSAVNSPVKRHFDFFLLLKERYQTASPLIPSSVGLVAGILVFVQLAIIPSRAMAMLATALAIACFYFRKHLLFGICLAVISCYSQLPSLSKTVLTDCNYSIHLQKRGYYSKVIEANAKNIVCSGEKINDQSILLWDNNAELRQLGVVYELRSNLAPVDKRLNFFEFDYQRYLYQQGIALEAKQIKSITPTQKIQSISQHIDKVRAAIQTTLSTHLNADNAAVAIALVTGDRGFLNDSQKQSIQNSATQHILAISGLHLTLVGISAWLLMQFVWSFIPVINRIIPPIQAGALFAWAAISIYAAISGFALPTQRAWIMFSVILFNWLLLRSIGGYSLLTALFIILLLQPFALFSSSLYLSFLATFVVLWTIKQPWIALVKIIFMQIFICIILTPTIWYHFGTIPTAGLLSNLIIIPWLTLAVLPSLAAALLLANTPLSPWLWQFAEFSLSALQSTLNWTASLELNLTPSWTPTLISVIAVTTAVVICLLWRRAVLLLVLVLPLLFIKPTTTPQILLAERKQTSALIHNGSEAMIINPGWRYRRRDDAELWLKILRAKNLTLNTIVLSDNRSSLAAATKTLLEHYPNSKVILLKDKDFPFTHSYCTDVKLDNLELVNVKNAKSCESTINWFNQRIDLFTDNTTANIQLGTNSSLVINGKTYSTKQLGMIEVNLVNGEIDINYAKKKKVLWRETQLPP